MIRQSYWGLRSKTSLTVSPECVRATARPVCCPTELNLWRSFSDLQRAPVMRAENRRPPSLPLPLGSERPGAKAISRDLWPQGAWIAVWCVQTEGQLGPAGPREPALKQRNDSADKQEPTELARDQRDGAPWRIKLEPPIHPSTRSGRTGFPRCPKHPSGCRAVSAPHRRHERSELSRDQRNGAPNESNLERRSLERVSCEQGPQHQYGKVARVQRNGDNTKNGALGKIRTPDP